MTPAEAAVPEFRRIGQAVPAARVMFARIADRPIEMVTITSDGAFARVGDEWHPIPYTNGGDFYFESDAAVGQGEATCSAETARGTLCGRTGTPLGNRAWCWQHQREAVQLALATISDAAQLHVLTRDDMDRVGASLRASIELYVDSLRVSPDVRGRYVARFVDALVDVDDLRERRRSETDAAVGAVKALFADGAAS